MVGSRHDEWNSMSPRRVVSRLTKKGHKMGFFVTLVPVQSLGT